MSDYHCDELPDSSCDNPFTETVEPCTLYETGGTQKMELGDFDGLQHTQNSDGVMMECEVWEWYVSNDGGKTKTYSHTTYENCQVLAQ